MHPKSAFYKQTHKVLKLKTKCNAFNSESSLRTHQLLFVCLVAMTAILYSGCATAKDNSSASDNKNAEQQKQGGPQTITVTTTQAITKDVPQTLLGTGSFVAYESSDVAPEVTGQVVATPVKVGAFVAQGAVLARLDSADAQARLQQALALSHYFENRLTLASTGAKPESG